MPALRLALLGFFPTLFIAQLSAQSKPPAPPTATLSLTVALVLDNLEVKPVPLFELWVTSTQGGDPHIARTHLDGTALLSLVPGSYRVESPTPLTVNGTTYEWNVRVDAPPGETRLELTNANATAHKDAIASAASSPETSVLPVSAPSRGPGPQDVNAPAAEGHMAPPMAQEPGLTGAASAQTTATVSVPAPAPRQRQMAPEMEVYQHVRSGVFRVEAGLSRGTGFLVDTSGLILTNAHVVSGQSAATVDLDSLARVEAQIAYRDDERDVAVLRVAATAVHGRPALPISVGTPLVDPGERVFAIGYPLHQEQSLTSGIVSGLREGAIISDVNINHGNSGGPLLNLAGEVVGINTFGDLPAEGPGPGISGSILITRAIEPLSVARSKIAASPPPSAALLPALPSGRFSAHDLKEFADSVKYTRYGGFDSISVGRFNVALSTPPISYVRQEAFEQIVGKDRKKREAKANLDQDVRYSELREARDWEEYVGDDRAPVVALSVDPKVGETSGSVFRRLLLTGRYGKTTLRYSADLEAAYIYRNGTRIVPLTGGTTPVKQYVDNQWVDLKDVANYGYYVLPAETFAPSSDGAPPTIVIELADLKNPGSGNCRALPPKIVATVWNDFVLYYRTRSEPFTVADPNVRPTAASNIDQVCAASRKARNAAPAERQDDPTPMGGVKP